MYAIDTSAVRTATGVLPSYRLEWEDDGAAWITSSTGREAELTPCELSRGEVLTFAFAAPARGLNRLAVKFSFDGAPPQGHLSAMLADASGQVLRWNRIDGQDLTDGAHSVVLDLAGLPFEPGEVYETRLRWFSEARAALSVQAGSKGRALKHLVRSADVDVPEPLVETVIDGLSPRHIIGWDDAGTSWIATQELTPEQLVGFVPLFLEPGRAFEFEFVRPTVPWRFLRIRFVIADRTAAGSISVKVVDEWGDVLRQRRLAFSEIDSAGFATTVDADWLEDDAPSWRIQIHFFGEPAAGLAIYAGPDCRDFPYGMPHPEKSIGDELAEPIIERRITDRTPHLRLTWGDADAFWSRTSRSVDPESACFAPTGLAPCCAVSFDIVSPAVSWTALEVQVATYGRQAKAHLSVRLYGPAGNLMHAVRLGTEEFTDNSFVTLATFEGLTFEIGETYRAEIAWFGEPGNEIALYLGEATRVAEGRSRLERLREGAKYQPSVETKTRGLLPKYEIAWEADGAAWTTSPTVCGAEPASQVPHLFLDREELSFDVIAPATELEHLKIKFATYGRRSSSYLAAKLVSLTGEVLRSRTWDTSSFADNALTPVLDLSGLAFEPGRKYRIVLHWFGSAEERLAVWVSPIADGRYELHRRLSHLSARRVFEPGSWTKVGRNRTAWLIATTADLERFGAQSEAVRSAFPDLAFIVVSFEQVSSRLVEIRNCDFAVFVDMHQSKAADGLVFDDLCMDLHRNRVCTLFFDSLGVDRQTTGMSFVGPAAAARAARLGQARRCHFRVSAGENGLSVEGATPWLRDAVSGGSAPSSRGLDSDSLAAMAAAVWAKSRPRVAIVSVLHRKATIIESFLEYVAVQSYAGEISIVLVDDTSPEDDAERALAFGRRLAAEGVGNRSVTVVANATNLGNCGSRLRGVAEAEADIIVVMDCDCLINRDFVAAHVFEHWWDDVDAVVGPLNIESNDRDPRAVVALLERNPALVAGESDLQDRILPEGFVNCITRNFSIKRRRLGEEPLFDTDFSYSAKPDSGFGWEDVEMGYRLYARGAVIRFTEDAFAVHCSHASSMPDDLKVLGSTRNFAKLFRKHPDMALVARRWGTDTYDRIVRWQESLGVPSGRDREELDLLFSEPRRELAGLLSGLRGESRRLRILTYRWHVPHQYELYKLPHDFTLATGLGHADSDRWAFDQRPLRPNARMVPIGEIDPRDYDLALLHFDENVLASHICNGIIPASWGEPLERFLAFTTLPKIAICHGTVPFVGQYGADPTRKHVFEPHEDERASLVGLLERAGVRVVCNSHQAHAEWGFADSRVIWHGLDPQEFPAGSRERDVLALKADFHRPHYRGAWEHEEVLRRLAPGIAVETAAHDGTPIESRSRNPYAVRNFRSYVDRIRSFKFYLNTTLRSPMPRSRSEAMMTGVVPVCLANHDVDRFIDNGVNGFYADQPEDLADFINVAMREPAMLEAMAIEARKTAMRVFNNDRYLAEWTNLLLETIAKS